LGDITQNLHERDIERPNKLKVQKFDIQGLMLIEPDLFKDARGFFTERFREDKFKEIGITDHFIQDNFSRSEFKTLRGLHYQYDKPQSKLVTCTHGAVLDVAVDIRKNSKTFGQHIKVVLEGSKPQWLWVPAGFAHGFCVLSEYGADVTYKVTSSYNPKGEGGIMWNDSELNIDWGIADPIVSSRDQNGMLLAQYLKDFKF
jgi:dTDP-4-dehydrorhamnose 3,5-epimerase